MKNIFVITIGREYGSGGREIGRKIADMFSIGFYDSQLLQEAAQESGLNTRFFEHSDERPPSVLNYLVPFSFGEETLSDGSMFRHLTKTIENVAQTHSCVIVGRCADYILRENDNVLNLFIHAPLEKRISRIMNAEKLTSQAAADLIDKTDKRRQAYYNFYTNKHWGAAQSYDMTIDSSVLGIDATVELIRDLVERWRTR